MTHALRDDIVTVTRELWDKIAASLAMIGTVDGEGWSLVTMSAYRHDLTDAQVDELARLGVEP